MPMLPSGWNNSVAQVSLAPPASAPEYPIPLWWGSGTYNGYGSGNTVAGGVLVQKGSTGAGGISAPGGTIYSYGKLHTLNVSWPATQKYALELAMESSISSSTFYAALHDCTTNTVVSTSQVSTTSTTFIALRSGQFTLTPGHVYGITLWTSNTSYGGNITDATLIVFP